MAELHVTSASNPRLKAVLALRRRRVREEEGRTVVDGYEELALALDAGVVPDTVLHCPELMLDAERAVGPRRAGPGPGREHDPAAAARPSRRSPTARAPTASSRSCRWPGCALDDLDLPARPARPRLRGPREAGQPRRGAAHRRGRRGGRRRRRRPGHRLGQPQRRAREQGHGLLGAGRGRDAPRRCSTGCGATASGSSRPPPTPSTSHTAVDYRGRGGDRRRHREGGADRRRAGCRGRSGSASRWSAGSTRSTPPRRPRSSSTRRSASGPGEAGVTL